MSTGNRIALALALFVALALIVVAIIAVGVSLLNRGGLSIGGDRVALLRVEGMIDNVTRHVELVREYRDDPRIQALIVRVDSGGGAVGSSQELFEELRRTDAEKPVIVSFGNVAASGGYYVALAGRRIFANPGTLTGSIGVMMTHVDTSGLLAERLGLQFTSLTSRENKDLASPWEPLSEGDRAMIEALLDDVHLQFVGAVRDQRTDAIRRAIAAATEGRKSDEITDAEIDAHLAQWCDGRPFTGTQALAEGFIDDTGTLQNAIDAAAEAVGIVGEPTVVEWHPRGGLFGPAVRSITEDLTAAVRDELTTQTPLRYQAPLP